MWKKFNFLCTIIISGTVGAFLGYSIYVCWEHKTQRDLDVLTSFPGIPESSFLELWLQLLL